MLKVCLPFGLNNHHLVLVQETKLRPPRTHQTIKQQVAHLSLSATFLLLSLFLFTDTSFDLSTSSISSFLLNPFTTTIFVASIIQFHPVIEIAFRSSTTTSSHRKAQPRMARHTGSRSRSQRDECQAPNALTTPARTEVGSDMASTTDRRGMRSGARKSPSLLSLTIYIRRASG